MIRAAHADDLAALVVVEASCFGPEAWSERILASELSAARLLLVAEREGAVVGYVDVSLAVDVADLLRVAVLPEHRRRGLADALLVEAHAVAAAEGAERILLEVADQNVAALGLYRRSGYDEISRRRRYYRDGSDALVLEKSLGAVVQ